MKKLIIVLLLLSFLFEIGTGQKTELNGIIYLMNSGYKPLSGVEISSEWGGDVTHDDGKFRLAFTDRKAGDLVRFNADKDGYEVVNSEKLITHLTKDRGYQHKIVMCPKGQLTRNRIQYYSIATESIIRNYHVKINQLHKDATDYKNQIAKLQEDTTLAFKQARKFALAYARINLDEVSGGCQKAFSYYSEGQIDSALIFLKGAKIENYEEIIKNQENQLKSAKAYYAQDCAFAAELYTLKLDFKSAEQYHKEAANMTPSIFKYNSDYALFLWDQKKYREAEPVYLRVVDILEEGHPKSIENAMIKLDKLAKFKVILGIEKNTKYEILLSSVYNDVAKFFTDYAKYDQAKFFFEKAIKLYNNIEDKGRFILLAEGLCYQNYGNLIAYMEGLEAALKWHLKSLEILRKMPSFSGDLNKTYFIVTAMMVVGLDYKHLGNHEKYEKYLRLSLNSIDSIKTAYEAALLDKAFFYMNFGNSIKEGIVTDSATVNTKQNKTTPDLILQNEQALPFYKKGLRILENLHEKNPKKYGNHLALLYRNIARTMQICLPDSSNYFHTKSLTIYMELAQQYPTLYFPDCIAVFTERMGPDLISFTQSTEEYPLRLANAPKEELDKLWLDAYDEFVGNVNAMCLGVDKYIEHPCQEIGGYGMLNISYFILEKLIERYYELSNNPEALYKNGFLQMRKNQITCSYSQKVKNFEKAITLFEKLMEVEKNRGLAYLIYTYDELSFLYIRNKKYEEATEVISKGMNQDVKASISYLASNQVLILLANNHIDLAIQKLESVDDERFREDVESKIEKLEKEKFFPSTITRFKEKLQSYKDKEVLVQKWFNHFDYWIGVADHLDSLGGSSDTLKSCYLKCVEAYENILQLDPTYGRGYSLSLIYENLIKVESSLPLKIKWMKIAIGLKEDVFELLPEKESVRANLSLSYGNMAWYYLLNKQFNNAIIYAEKGLEITPKEYWIEINLAHAYFFTGKWHKAKRIYVKHKNKPYNNTYPKYSDAIIADFEEFQKKEIYMEGLSPILFLLED